MAKKDSAWLTEIYDTGYLKNFGTIFISKGKKIMARDSKKTWAALARKISGEFFAYSVKKNKLIITDVKAEKSLELELPATRSY